MTDLSQRFGGVLVELGLTTPARVEEALELQQLTGQKLGEALLSLGYVTRADVQQALSVMLGKTVKLLDQRPVLGELLIGLKYATEAEVDRALAQQKHDRRPLGDILVDMGVCTLQQVFEAVGVQRRMGKGENEPPDDQKTRVMVVDDSALALSLITEGLSLLGYAVETFDDPGEALKRAPDVKPDIILTDLDMPGMDGAELCRQLKSGPLASTPVIILTANDGDGQRVTGLRAGADDYVRKGASMEEIAARISGILRRTGEADRVRQVFARYTSDAVVEEILKQGTVKLSGEKREVTLLFADIRNFTSLAEALEPEAVMALLNDVLGRLADAVLSHHGTLDKYLGDGLMAVFGAPVRRSDDAEQALACARAMMTAVADRNEKRAPGSPVLELGVGINTGEAVVGTIGSERRSEYTCIGDAVNVAARLCALAGPGEILLGETTAARVTQATGIDVPELEPLPPVKLKGKSQPVPLFRAL